MTNHHEIPILGRLGRTLHVWRRRYAERTELGAWAERDLNDVGLTRDDVLAEIEKPFWRR